MGLDLDLDLELGPRDNWSWSWSWGWGWGLGWGCPSWTCPAMSETPQITAAGPRPLVRLVVHLCQITLAGLVKYIFIKTSFLAAFTLNRLQLPSAA